MIGHDQKEWPHTMDAVVWAKEFIEMVRRDPSIPTDEPAMISWFANAIMRGWDERCHALERQENALALLIQPGENKKT